MELVSPYCSQALFLNLAMSNQKEEPEKIVLSLEKNYPILQKSQVEKSWLALDRLRISASSAGEKSLYYTQCTDEEWIRVIREPEFNFTYHDML